MREEDRRDINESLEEFDDKSDNPNSENFFVFNLLRLRKEQALKIIKNAFLDKGLADAAIYEIEYNYKKAGGYLRDIKGRVTKPDLSRIHSLYECSESYRGLCNHFETHLARMSLVSELVESGEYRTPNLIKPLF